MDSTQQLIRLGDSAREAMVCWIEHWFVVLDVFSRRGRKVVGKKWSQSRQKYTIYCLQVENK